MSAAFVKYCTLCDHENLAIASFCEDCDADLMNAPVELRRDSLAPASQAPIIADAPMPEVSPQKDLVKDLVEAEQNELATVRFEQKAVALELELVANPAIRFVIQAGQSVGRASKADVVLTGVPSLEYISRAHAQFFQRRSQWYVKYLAEGNSISVDGVEVRDATELAVYDGSIVVFSFTPFRVKFR